MFGSALQFHRLMIQTKENGRILREKKKPFNFVFEIQIKIEEDKQNKLRKISHIQTVLKMRTSDL